MAVTCKPVGAFRRGLRRCGAVASMALVPLLLAQIGTLWFLHDGAEIVVPNFARERLRARLAEAGLDCTWREARVSLSGRIQLKDAKVGVAGGAGTVFEAERLVTVLDAYDLVFSGRVRPRRLWLDRGRLLCPAALSPSGKPEAALEDIHAALSLQGNRLVVETLQAHCAGIPLVAHGTLFPAGVTVPGGSSDSSAAHPLRAPGLAAARIISLRPWLQSMEGASLELTGEDTAAGIRLTLEGTAGAIRFPGVDVERVRLKFGALWDAAGPHPEGRAGFVIGALRVDLPASQTVPAIKAASGRVYVGTTFGKDWSLPTSARLTAHELEVAGHPLDRLVLHADWAARPKLKFDVDALWHRENIAARVALDTNSGVARVDYDASVRTSEITKYPAYPKQVPAEVAALRMDGFSDLSGTVNFGPRYAFTDATVKVESGRTVFGAIDVGSFRGMLHIRPDWVRADHLDALSPEQRVQGFFESGFKADSPYRLVLTGNAYPEQVSPFVGVWWTKIWKDLAVTPGYPAFADIDVSGSWSGRPDEFIYGAIRAQKLAYRKQVFDRAAIRVIEEPHRLSITDMRIANDDGTHAAGRLEWRHRLPDHAMDSVRFRFEGKLPLKVAAELGGEDVVEALADVKLAQPADAVVTGRYHGPASATPSRDQLEVAVVSHGAFDAWKIPGEDFSGTVLLDGNRIQVKGAKLRYAGGDATADAWIHRLPEGYRLTLDTTFEKADRVAFFAGLAGLKDPKPGAPVKPVPPKPAVPPDLSGHFTGRLVLPDIATLDGRGAFVTHDPALFKLPLFGALTLGLEKMGIDVGNYEFNSADTEFIIRQGYVYMPSLTVRGPTAVVDLKGRYGITGEDLHFRAVLNPKSPDSIPLLDWARSMMNRTTRLFPVNIRGVLDDPKWSIDPTPSALFEAKNDDRIALPPAPAPDDGKW